MSFSDFFTHFAALYVARYFDKSEYTEICVENEWSVAANTAGGCSNYPSFPQNPQFKLAVTAFNPQEPVDLVMSLTVFGKKGDSDAHCFGYRGFKLGGKPVTSQYNDKPVFQT